MSSFQNFTNQYALSKTLRFELKPVGNTQTMLEEAKIFQEDEIIQEKYKKTKPYFDRLHREFIEFALSATNLGDFENYYRLLKEWKKDKNNKDNKKNLENEEAKLRKALLDFFNLEASNWLQDYAHLKIKKKDVDFLFEEEIFAVLKARYGNEPETEIFDESTGKTISIFDSWKGFAGYFDKFFQTRKNFYKDDAKAGRVATRIIDQNLKRFCDNKEVFEKIKDKLDFSEVEKNFGIDVDTIFSFQFYNECFLQSGIDSYNMILGGKTLENGEKQKGLNEVINKFRQDNKADKLPFFKLLDKQIGSEKQSFIENIKDADELHTVLTNFVKIAEEKSSLINKLFSHFTNNFKDYDLAQIYISKEALNTIAHKWTGEIKNFEHRLFEAMKKETSAKYEKKDDTYSFPDFIALHYVQLAFESETFKGNFWKERYYENIKNFVSQTLWEQFLIIFHFEFQSLFEQEIERHIDKDKDFHKILESVKNTEDLVSFDESNRIIKSKIGYNIFIKKLESLLENFNTHPESKIIIKNFADSVLTIYQMAKYFSLEKKRKWLDEYETGDFYKNPDFGYSMFYTNAYEDIVQTYNDLRNYLTKKPYSEEKWKLNFQNPTLADGWDKNKEPDNFAVLLKKEGKYYLGIMSKGNNKIFDDRNAAKLIEGIENGRYEKVVYKFFPDQAKMFPKVCFSEKGRNFFDPSQEILDIYTNSEFKHGETFSIQSMQKLIDFYKDCLKQYEGWQCYTFQHLKPTTEYKNNIGEFFRDVAEDGYRIDFQNISEKYIQEKNKNGELYLFEIYNQDFAEGKKSKTKNLHTLYFESLFSKENIEKNFLMKLNGQAELFFRPKTDEQDLGIKEDTKGKKVINHKRYNSNKIFFHVPMTFNRTKSDPYQFNAQINNFLATNPSINIIGVDRGEKHLAYYSVIKNNGDIIDSGSLNTVNNVDYAEKLEAKAKNREQARKDWQEVEGIKNLKKGYISQVVHTLADLAIEHNAIIVFEDLNMRFKQIRGGIEKSIYQQLEKALIEKLSFLVKKNEIDPNKAGHLLKAYQLSAPFTTFKEMGKQTGIIFYTQAAYTSRIDPITGWRPHLYLKYSSAENAKKDMLLFSNIEFKNGRFEFTYDIKNFQPNNKEYAHNTIWTVCSSVERFRWNKNLNNNKGGYEHFSDITNQLQKLFENYKINVHQGHILSQIEILDAKGNESFFRDLIFYFNLICQIRNTDEKASDPNKQDFILSPVVPFFDSRKDNDKNLPKNGDDNGAYNIARKGIMILDKIQDFHAQNEGCEKMTWKDLYISHTEWDDFARK